MPTPLTLRKARQGRHGFASALRSGVVVDPGMCVSSLYLGEPGDLVSGRAASLPRRSVSGRRGAVAGDERTREVTLRHSSCEADEQSRATGGGAGGAKGGDRGKRGTGRHAPDAEPGRRVTRSGPRTESSKGKEEGEVHRAPTPRHRRRAGRGVPRIAEGRSAGRRRSDVGGLRDGPRAQARGPAFASSPGSVSGAAEPAGLYSQAGWPAASAGDRRVGGQGRPESDGDGAECDLRGRTSSASA